MIDDILDRMTLEEQVSLLSGADFWPTAPIELANDWACELSYRSI